ncbi:hypothetical protein BJ741DRAFT_688372 [Chytriomyces cf. hyalinus JEL632]|nr:hypothetical protein BJ741DRAFT_688372 [Chytriomyces cf. hyalinus JEL632]
MSTGLLRRQLLGLNLGLLGAPKETNVSSQQETVPPPASQVASAPKQPSAAEAISPLPVPAAKPAQADTVPQSTSDQAVQQQQLPAGLTLEQMQQLQQTQLFREQQQLEQQRQAQQENSPGDFQVTTGVQDQTSSDRHEAVSSASPSNRAFITFTQTTLGNAVKSIQVPAVKPQDQVTLSGTSPFSGVQPTLAPSFTDAVTPAKIDSRHDTSVGLALGITIPAFVLLAAFIYAMYRRHRTRSLNTAATATEDPLKSGWAQTEIEVKSGAESRSSALTNLQRFPTLYNLATRKSSVTSKTSCSVKERSPDAAKLGASAETRISRQSEQDLEMGLESELFNNQVSDVSYRISVKLPVCDNIELETNASPACRDARNTS